MAKQRGRPRNNGLRDAASDTRSGRDESPDLPLIHLKNEGVSLEPRVVLRRLDITFCSDCYVIFSNQTDLRHHKTSQSCKKRQCSGIKDGCSLQFGIARIEAASGESRDELCPLCGDPDTSVEHFTTHHQQKGDCWICFTMAKEFNYDRVHHMSLVHRLPQASLYCQICSKLCGSEFVRRHVATSHCNMKRTRLCAECGQIFRNECALSVHETYQHGKMPKRARKAAKLMSPNREAEFRIHWESEQKVCEDDVKVNSCIAQQVDLGFDPCTRFDVHTLTSPASSFATNHSTLALPMKRETSPTNLTVGEVEIKMENPYEAFPVYSDQNSLEAKPVMDREATVYSGAPVPVAFYCTPDFGLPVYNDVHRGTCADEIITDEIRSPLRTADVGKRTPVPVTRDVRSAQLLQFEEDDIITNDVSDLKSKKWPNARKPKRSGLRGSVTVWLNRRNCRPKIVGRPRAPRAVSAVECICIVCCKTFKSDLKLKLHMLTHK